MTLISLKVLSLCSMMLDSWAVAGAGRAVAVLINRRYYFAALLSGTGFRCSFQLSNANCEIIPCIQQPPLGGEGCDQHTTALVKSFLH
jgi:hypothetical protein